MSAVVPRIAGVGLTAQSGLQDPVWSVGPGPAVTRLGPPSYRRPRNHRRLGASREGTGHWEAPHRTGSAPQPNNPYQSVHELVWPACEGREEGREGRAR